MAAEAFLGGFNADTDPDLLVQALIRGNEHASAFPTTLAKDFANKFIVVAHQENTSTGFSGTLFRSKVPDANNRYEYTLSFRSTEFIDDAIRDSKGTNDLEIRKIGWALGQIADMEDWYRTLLAAGQQGSDKGLPPDAHFNVTGYSLSGHLASAFMLLRRDDNTVGKVDHAYTFNGAGTGGLHFGISLDKVVAQFDEMRELARPRGPASMQDIQDANGRVRQVLDELRRISGFKNTFTNDVVPPPGAFVSLAYQLAAVLSSRNTIPSSNFPLPAGDINTIPLKRKFAATEPFTQLTEIFGADGGDSDSNIVDGRFSFVSFSGQHYSEESNSFGVYIEDQPRTRGNYSLVRNQGELVENPNQNGFSDTHSLVLLVDSLALMSTFTELDPNLSQHDIEAIFRSSSNSRQRTVPGTAGKAEGDTLERALDSLRRVFQGPDIDPLPTKLDGNTWADLDDRETFHSTIKALVDSPAFKLASGLVEVKLLPSDATSLEKAADTDIAFRFALETLSPFAVTGNPGLFASYNMEGELDPFNPNTGKGEFTPQFVIDRSAFMAAQLELFEGNKDYVLNSNGANIRFEDLGSETTLSRLGKAQFDLAERLSIRPDADSKIGHLLNSLGYDEQYIFGSRIAATGDLIRGGPGVDHLYGAAGNDVLRGNGGNDYLQGDAGDDHLIAGTGADTLLGGSGDDVLDGGAGTDKYYFYTGGGHDTVIDLAEASGPGYRQLGEVYFNDVRVNGRFMPTGADIKDFTFDLAGQSYRASYFGDINTSTPGKLMLWNEADGSNVVTLTKFISGDFGIVLDPDAPPRVYTDKLGTDDPDNSLLVGVPHQATLSSDAPDQRVFGYGGADYIVAGNDNVLAYGGEGNDYITNGAGDQGLYGRIKSVSHSRASSVRLAR